MIDLTHWRFAGEGHKEVAMSLRDYFAGQALAGILAGGFADTVPHDDVGGGKDAAFFAYQYADAMLARRVETLTELQADDGIAARIDIGTPRMERVDNHLARQLGESIALNSKLKEQNERLKAEIVRLNELLDSIGFQRG